MSSNDTPAKMEEKLFENPSTKNITNVNKKSATNDFLNSETESYDMLNESERIISKNSNQYKEKPDDINESNEEINSSSKESSGLDLNDPSKQFAHTLYNSQDNESNTHPQNYEPMYKQPDPSIDNELPETVTLLKTPEGDKCYLIGTAHFSIESQNDVSKIIQAVQPHIVMVELCKDRVHILHLDEEAILKEAKELNLNKIMDVIKRNGVHKGLFYLLLINMSANITKMLGLAPGGEFRRALIEANKIPQCLIQLGDRPIKVTFARALSALTWWQTFKLAWQLLTEKGPISQDDIEKYKCRDSLEEMMAELAGEYPPIKEVFVKERDIYLTHSLQVACKHARLSANDQTPGRVVGVVGMGHTLGIVEHWGKVKPSDIPNVMSIPPPSLSSRMLKCTLKASVIGGVCYVGYRFILIPTGVANSMQNLFKKCVSFVPMLLSE